MPTLTMTRRGTFTIERAHDDAAQCGPRGTRRFFYTVQVECPSDALDGDGFIVDQLDVAEFMQSSNRRWRVVDSCELMALNAAHGLYRLCPSARRVRVTVGASRDAYMTAEVVASEAHPGRRVRRPRVN